ncbi:hypothetical protein [Shimazuella kribbensis]|uniref:hypothetical protein n=1 Tax=Shimazuella kribbensis TaxID=139808 RepID=UPI00048DCF38|nr:hypothetical protein [Shimazuella kribbensis]
MKIRGDRKKIPDDKKKIHKDYRKGYDGDDDDDDASIGLCTISYTFLTFAFHSDDTFSYGDTCDVTFLDHMVLHGDVEVYGALVDGKVDMVWVGMVDMLV